MVHPYLGGRRTANLTTARTVGMRVALHEGYLDAYSYSVIATPLPLPSTPTYEARLWGIWNTQKYPNTKKARSRNTAKLQWGFSIA